jgi:hypothetical protein
MKPRSGTWLAVVSIILCRHAYGGEQTDCPPPQQSLLKRFHPVGGWHPYGGGLLHWWPHHCFPCCGAPDDYCRKPPPCVCRPHYPPWYTWGPPEIVYPHAACSFGP